MEDRYTFTVKKLNRSFTVNTRLFYYIPVIGWMLPMAFKKEDPLAMNHARQGFVMAVMFTAVLVTLSFIMIFVSRSHRIFRFSIVMLIYLVEMVYFSLCIWGTILAYRGREAFFPVIKKYADRIDI